MGGINLNESGLDFVRQVFVTFGGNTTVLTLFLLSVLYLALKEKGRAVCVRNNRCFSGLYGIQSICGEIYPGKTWMVNVYYRFFWILPMVLTMDMPARKLWAGRKKAGDGI